MNYRPRTEVDTVFTFALVPLQLPDTILLLKGKVSSDKKKIVRGDVLYCLLHILVSRSLPYSFKERYMNMKVRLERMDESTLTQNVYQ